MCLCTHAPMCIYFSACTFVYVYGLRLGINSVSELFHKSSILFISQSRPRGWDMAYWSSLSMSLCVNF